MQGLPSQPQAGEHNLGAKQPEMPSLVLLPATYTL